MNHRLCKMRTWVLVISMGVSAVTVSHACSAASSQSTVESIASRIPQADQVEPVMPNRLAHESQNAPFRLRCDWTQNPLGVQQRHPRLTWMPPQRNALLHQAQYQIQVAASQSDILSGHALLWDSGKVGYNPHFLPQYAGPAFRPFTHYYWRVRIWSRAGWKSQWSSVASWMTGPLAAGDWHGHWISYRPHISNPFYKLPNNAYFGLPQPKQPHYKSWIQKQPCPIFRKVFRSPANLRHAYMYIAGLGYWKVRVNGHKVGSGVLYSTLYDYSKTVPFQTFDITKLLHKGQRNVIAISLGNGWYNIMEHDVWNWQNAAWNAWPRTRMNLLMRTTGGKADWIATNSAWQAAPGPRLADGLYNGEVYDARLKLRGWNDPRRALAEAAHARIVKAPTGRLTAQFMPPCQVLQRLAPESITEVQPHVFVVKFPQNMSGWVTLTARGKAGVPVVLRYGERVFANGTVNRDPISIFAYTGTFQQDTFIPAGSQPFTYHPNFAYNGFQYVQISGLASRKDILKIQADFIHTAFRRSGRFWCANPLLNAVVDAASRSYCSNFMGYPTDCPTREKNGWTGDAWLGSVQGMMAYNNQLGYAKWLNDMHDTQYANGALRVVMPDPSGWDWDGGQFPDPDWESAYEFICWNQYLYEGDGRVLREHYQDLKHYFQFVMTYAPHGILPPAAGIGDWVSSAKTTPPIPFTSGCILYHDAVLLSRIASVLHRSADAATFTARAAALRAAFNKRFYKGNGVYNNGGQTAEANPLYYGLATNAMRAKVLQRLLQDIHSHHDHLDVGILGAKCLFRVLSASGHTALAYRIATQTTYPSYGQWILHGATTLWEQWGLDPASMNHIMFGDIVGWMYNDLAGIRPDWRSPGFRTILISPHPIKALPWVAAEHESQFGLIQSAWRWHGTKLTLTVVIPPASSAFVTLPGAGSQTVLCNGKPMAAGADGVLEVKLAGQSLIIHVGPGHYHLAYSPHGIR